MNIEEFTNKCSENKLSLTDKQINQFILYAKLLKEWNEKMNLTGITEFDEVLDKHFMDSLLISFNCEFKGSLCDIGAGAGFPSIPLKIAYPELEVIIIEPLNKRVKFLNAVVDELRLENIKCYCERAEDFIVENREKYDFVTARAVANLNILAELCIPFVKVGGCFIAMKGSQGNEEESKAKKATRLLGCEIENKDIRILSDGSQRINLYYKKISKTPIIYPRNYGRIKKSPL